MAVPTSASVLIDEFMPHPIERVWSALTEPAAIARWLMPNDFHPQPGHEFTLQTQPYPALKFDGAVRCRVTAIEPPKLLAYTWVGGPVDTLVTYRLVEAQRDGVSGTLLHFEQSGFDLSRPAARFARDGAEQSWSTVMLPALRRLLDERAEAA